MGKGRCAKTMRLVAAAAVCWGVVLESTAAYGQGGLDAPPPTSDGMPAQGLVAAGWGWFVFGCYAFCAVGVVAGGAWWWWSRFREQSQSGHYGMVIAGLSAAGAVVVTLAVPLVRAAFSLG